MAKPVVNVASKSLAKVNAVKSALDLDRFEVLGHDTCSGVSAQPFGFEEIKAGALNRLLCVKELPCVAFETGIIEGADGVWYDITLGILRTNLGDFYNWSFDDLQEIPSCAIESWKAIEDETARRAITLGSLIAREMGLNRVRVQDGELMIAIPCYCGDSKFGQSRCAFCKMVLHSRDWYLAFGGLKSRQEIISNVFSRLWTKFMRNADLVPPLPLKLTEHKGVPFIDIQDALCESSQALSRCVHQLSKRILFDVVVVTDARGFLFAFEFANPKTRIVMARKPGKLPGEVYVTVPYKKEYASKEQQDMLCIQVDAIPEGSNVVIVDDVCATGETLYSIGQLVEDKFKSKVVAYLCPFAVETSPGVLMCKYPQVQAKLRFAHSQLTQCSTWKYEKQPLLSYHFHDDALTSPPPGPLSTAIRVVPPSFSDFAIDDQRATISWKEYSASSHIEFAGEEYKDKDVEVYLNTMDQSEMFQVLSILKILHCKDPKTITVIVPFMEQATQDRIEFNGEMQSLAQIGTIAQMIGNHKVVTFDLHAEQSQLAFYDLRNQSLVVKLFKLYMKLNPESIVVFPDDGAAKRFSKLLKVNSDQCVIFRKTRGEGDKRRVETEDETKAGAVYVIIDDLVRSGSTLHAVASYLIEKRNAKSVAALFAHAPLEPHSYRNLDIFNGNIWTSGSVPNVPSEFVRINDF